MIKSKYYIKIRYQILISENWNKITYQKKITKNDNIIWYHNMKTIKDISKKNKVREKDLISYFEKEVLSI